MIAIGCDHAATELKNKIKNRLESQGFTVKDFGCHSNQAVDYPDYAIAVAKAVASGECEKGVLICGTGIGMSIAAFAAIPFRHVRRGSITTPIYWRSGNA